MQSHQAEEFFCVVEQSANKLATELGTEFVSKLIDAFLSNSVEQARGLENLCNSGKFDEVARAAHSLRPNFATFGLIRVEDLLSAAEELAVAKSSGLQQKIKEITALLNPAESALIRYRDSILHSGSEVEFSSSGKKL